MRRKSERNKGKQSPEKKPEKPTRKSTRRRAKKSPSTSPERSHSPENEPQPDKDPQSLSYKIQTRHQSKDTPENLIEEPESKVTSTEQITGDDATSVWKVARADASPGEIQKLKLCRQRNLSETSDVSLSRKRMTKWQEGEGADSADERPATSNDKTYSTIGLADDTSSTTIERESGEEVSDSKDIPPETTTVDLSDVKQNIDHSEQQQQADDNHDDDDDDDDDDDVHKLQSKDQHDDVHQLQDKGQQQSQQGHEGEKEIQLQDEHERAAPTDDKHAEVDKIQQQESNEETRTSDKEEFIENVEQEEEKPDDQHVEKVEINESVEESEEKIKSDDEEDKPKIKETAERNNSSDDENDDRTSRTRISRRKHRDKYRDSSNSESGESEEESGRRERRRKESPQVEIEKKKIVDSVEKREKSPQGEKSLEEAEAVEKNELEEKREDIADVVENDKGVEEEEEEKPQTVCKPAKVNLKRSFTSRISTDESKKDDAGLANDASQDKENHVADVPRTIPKRRRWGTVLSTDIPVLSISTDSLKALVPGAKPLSLNEVRLSKDDEEDRNRRKDKRQAINDGDKSKADNDNKNDNSKDNHIGIRRKISIIKDTPQLLSSSPSVAQPTSILLIKNLVRPFTLNQIKELLSRTGTIVENGFWMDRIKSKCFVEYANEDQAFETRQALHGISWPSSNPKKLQVEYSINEEMEKAKESSKDQPLSRKLEASSGGDVWQQDWGRDEKSNLTTKVTVVREWDLGKEDGQHLLLKDKEKEKKDMDKKRRQRSRSPTLEAHLPAPARKFKKKEDEPPPAKLLDDLFRKTKSAPCIYWLPLTNEQIVVKEEMRRQHMAEHARRLEEMRRAERNRDGRRRRSPRK